MKNSWLSLLITLLFVNCTKKEDSITQTNAVPILTATDSVAGTYNGYMTLHSESVYNGVYTQQDSGYNAQLIVKKINKDSILVSLNGPYSFGQGTNPSIFLFPYIAAGTWTYVTVGTHDRKSFLYKAATDSVFFEYWVYGGFSNYSTTSSRFNGKR